MHPKGNKLSILKKILATGGEFKTIYAFAHDNKLPIATVHYNLKQLEEGGILVVTDNEYALNPVFRNSKTWTSFIMYLTPLVKLFCESGITDIETALLFMLFSTNLKENIYKDNPLSQ